MTQPRIKTKYKVLALVIFTAVLLTSGVHAQQTTAFTYQGRLTDTGNPASGNYDLQFGLFDNISTGAQIGATLSRPGVVVTGGVFTVPLDFGVNAFPGADRFLEISVRPSSGGNFIILSPRQQISSTPYAIHTLRADALSSACVACVQDAQISAVSASKLSGTLPVDSIPSGNGNYIQNSTTVQAGSNFNVSGNGLVGGNLGIGTPSPVSKLHLFGSANILAPFRGLTIDQTVNVGGNTNGYAMSVATTTGGVTSPNFLINSLGNTGVGTGGPAARLHVAQSGDFQLRLDNPAAGGGFWSIGQADNSFHSGGGKLVFVPNTIESTNAAVVFTNAGRVGIGTVNPAQLLHVNSVSGNAGALVQTPTNAFAQYQLQSGATNPWIIGTQDNFNGNALLFRYGGADLIKVQSNGNITQPLDKGGLVKAMVYVDFSGSISRCYNSLLTGSAATTAPCGFTTDHFTNGGYTVDFHFVVSDRFVSVTAQYCTCIHGEGNFGVNFDDFTDTSLHIFTFHADQSSSTNDSSFMIIVY